MHDSVSKCNHNTIKYSYSLSTYILRFQSDQSQWDGPCSGELQKKTKQRLWILGIIHNTKMKNNFEKLISFHPFGVLDCTLVWVIESKNMVFAYDDTSPSP